MLPALYATTMLLLMPSEFIYDWQHNLGRVNDGNALIMALTLGINYEQFLAFDYWLPLGILGIFTIPSKKVRMTLVLFVVAAMILILKIRNPNPFFRTAVPILPFVCLGLAVLLVRATEYLYKWGIDLWHENIGQHWRRAQTFVVMGSIFAVVYFPLTATFVLDIAGVQSKFPTRADDFLANSARDAQSVAEFINTSTNRDDLVIASSHISWLLTPHTADLLQAVVAEGKGTAFYPANMPVTRFVYDAHYERAKYVVLDNFSRMWAKQMPEERIIADEVSANWYPAFNSGEYTVYRNPMLR